MDIPSNQFNQPKPAFQQPELPKMEPAFKLPEVKDDTLAKIFRSVIKADMKSVGNTVLNEVIVPTMVKMAHDALNSGFNKLFGYNGGYSSTPIPRTGSFNSNGAAYHGAFYEVNRNDNVEPPEPVSVNTGLSGYSAIPYGSGDEGMANARNTIVNMRARAKLRGSTGRYPAVATVAELCDTTNRQSVSTDHYFAWTIEMIDCARIVENFDHNVRIVWPTPINVNLN